MKRSRARRLGVCIVLAVAAWAASAAPAGTAAAAAAPAPAALTADADPADAPLLRVEAGTHIAAIRALASDAQGRVLLTASEDKTARLWRIADQQLLRVLRPPIGADNEGKLYAAALSPDAGVAAVAGWSADNEVYLFDAGDATLRGRIAGLPNVIDALAFSPDGHLLAVLLWGGQGLRLYASSDGWRSAREVGADAAYGGAPAYGLAFAPDGTRLLTSAYDGRLRVYALRGASLWRIAQLVVGGKPHGLAFAPDGASLAVGFADAARVGVLGVRGGDALTPQWDASAPAGGALPCVAWSHDGAALYAGGSWRSAPGRHPVLRWDGAAHQLSQVPAASDSITALLAAAGPAPLYASGDASWGVVGGPARTSARADFRLPAAQGPSSLRVSADGRELRFATRFGGAALRDFDLGGPTWRAAAPLAPEPAAAAAIDVRDWQDSAQPRLAGRPLPLGPGEVSLALGRDPAGRAFALGTNHRLRLYAADGRPLWDVAVPAPCFAVQLSADGRWVVAGFGDGTLRWFRRDDGAETLAFYAAADDAGWALWTPDGRYAAGGGGEQRVGWQLDRGADVAAEFLPLARFAERYFDPLGAISAIGDAPQRRPLPDLRAGLALPPSVQFLSPHSGGRVDADSVAVALDVVDRGGGIAEVRLLRNGKVVQTAMPEVAKGSALLRFDLPLEGGTNAIEAVALARDRTASAPVALELQAPARPGRPRLHVLAVGLNEYRNSQFNLRFSVPDARSVAAIFRALGGKLFADVEVDELYDAAATRAGILAKLHDFGATRPDDVVVVYLAGHGETIGDDWFFVPWEVTEPEVDAQLRREGLSSRELAAAIKAMPARKVVVLIDACKSGAALASFRGLEERRLLAQLSRATGTHLIAATDKDQEASELQTLGHGVFTYTLLEGLGGKAATAGAGDVTALKLMAYVEAALPELSKRYHTVEQFPVVSSTGMDFPLVLP